jgi:hypothetical protein
VARHLIRPAQSLDSRSTTILLIFVAGLPIWWALGLDFLTPAALAVLLVLANLAPHRDVRPTDMVLLGIIALFTLSAVINGFFAEWQPLRVWAALYNISILTAGLIVLQHSRAALRTPAGLPQFLKTAAFAFVVFALVAWSVAIVAYASGQLDRNVPTLLGAFVGKGTLASAAPLIERSAQMGLTRPDWGIPGTPIARVYIYGPYPSATAVIAAVLGASTLLFVRRSPARSLGGVVQLLVVGTLLLTLTRTVVVGWLAGLAIANLVFGSPLRRMLAIVAVSVGVLLAVQSDTGSVNSYRPPTGRFVNYERAVRETLEASPIIGKGFKAREEGNHIAIGSHSTLVSAFTKGGIVGLALVALFFFVVPALRWVGIAAAPPRTAWPDKADLRILLTLQVTLWSWLCFEDIDAPAMAAMLIFISLGLIEVATRSGYAPASLATRRAVPQSATVIPVPGVLHSQ